MRQLLAGLGGSFGAFAAAGVFVALIAGGYWVQANRNAEAVAPVMAAVPADSTPTPEAPVVVEEEAPEVVVAEPEQVIEDAPVADAIAAPTFDEVRREADGVTVIAGKGQPGAEIMVLQNGQKVAQATADSAGKFATIALIPPDGVAYVLTLLQMSGGQELASADEIILAPLFAPVEVAEAVEEAEPTQQAPIETAEIVVAEEPEPQVEPPAPAAEPEPVEQIAPEPVVTQEPQAPETAPVEPVVIAEQAPSAPQEQAAPVDTPVAEAKPEPEAPKQQVAATDAPASAPVQDTTGSTALAAIDVENTQPAPAVQTLPVQAPIVQQPEPQVASVPEVVPTAPTVPEVTPAPRDVAVLKSTAEGVELLSAQAPEVLDNVAIDTISYSDVGDVQLAGRAQSDATAVRVYLDNSAILDLPVDAAGRWRGDLPNVDEGIYTLRIDEVSAAGNVTSRVETPFKREAPEVLAAAAAGIDGPIKAITVQKGATLWAIARERYGEGELYVRVFEANRKTIRNPDLIYPGQVFDLPD